MKKCQRQLRQKTSNTTQNFSKAGSEEHYSKFLKLLSQPLWIVIPKIKTNLNKQQNFTDYHYQ